MATSENPYNTLRRSFSHRPLLAEPARYQWVSTEPAAYPGEKNPRRRSYTGFRKLPNVQRQVPLSPRRRKYSRRSACRTGVISFPVPIIIRKTKGIVNELSVQIAEKMLKFQQFEPDDGRAGQLRRIIEKIPEKRRLLSRNGFGVSRRTTRPVCLLRIPRAFFLIRSLSRRVS
jgi:hypothetical protein